MRIGRVLDKKGNDLLDRKDRIGSLIEIAKVNKREIDFLKERLERIEKI